MAKATRRSRWANKIVGEGFEAPDQLLAHPDNFRIHSHAQEQALDEVLSRVGWVQRVIVNKRSGRVLDGHLRVAMAISRSETKVPVTYVNLNDADEKLVLATFDPVGAMATRDAEKARELVESIDVGDDAAIQAVLDDIARTGQDNDTSTVLDQAVQLRPGREYVLVMCADGDEGAAQFEALREAFGLQNVRRGGYKRGSAFDDVGVERVIHAAEVLTRVRGSSE